MPVLRKPDWLRVKLGGGKIGGKVRGILDKHGRNTVCSSAECPNRGECFERQVATFLILGDHCTRGCTFCAVPTGQPLPPDPKEAEQVAQAAKELELRHVVITSVTRDDLPDGGASQFVDCVEAVRQQLPTSTIEVLTPDFQGDLVQVDKVLNACIDVFNHNVETVPRLYGTVRCGAEYQRSLKVLQHAATRAKVLVKSGMMLGLGETRQEISQVMQDLFDVGVRAITIGQYLKPRHVNIAVERYVTPEEFAELEVEAKTMGFEFVKAAPLVRSSYLADHFVK